MSSINSSTLKLMSIGERIAGLSSLPELPEENWRRTDPADFFVPAEDVLNSFGQPVVGSHLASSPYKIHFRTVTQPEMNEAVRRVLGLSGASLSEMTQTDDSRLVLLEINNGGLTVLSCASADSWVGRLEIASRPSRPEAVMRESFIASALAERLQICAPSELVIRIPKFEHVPVVILGVETDSAFTQSYSNVSVDVADDAVAEIAVIHGTCAFAHHRVTLRIGKNARVSQFWSQFAKDPSQESRMLIERKVKLGGHAKFSDASVFVPSGTLRVISNIVAEAEGAEAQCGAAVIAAGNAVVDYEPLQDHLTPRSQSHLRAKMLAGQRGKAVFQGLINVEREAAGTCASQINKNLVLSKRARVDAMPRLRILPDEVSCKHGSATGEIDKKQMYYLQTRGFTGQQAQELIVGGFILDGISQLPEESPLQSWAVSVLSEGLGRVLKQS